MLREGEIDEITLVNWQVVDRRERMGNGSMRDYQDGQVGQEMARENNKRIILIKGAIMLLGRNLVSGKPLEYTSIFPGNIPSNSGEGA